MPKYYTITEVKWKLVTEEIAQVNYVKHRNNYNIDIKDDVRNYGFTITPEVFELFKKEFPEHCIDIKMDDSPEVPF